MATMNGMSKPKGKPDSKSTPLGKLVGQFVRLSGAERAGEIVDKVVLSAISHEPLPATRIGEDRRNGILYSDTYSKALLKKRRHDFWAFFSVCAGVLSLIVMLCVFTFVGASDRSTWDQIWAIFLSVALFLLSFVLVDFFLMDERNIMRYGIVLTTDGLSLYDTEMIPINDVLRALVIVLWGDRRRFLAIDIKEWKKGGSRVRSIFILDRDTEDIFQLRDAIKEVKKWGGKAQLRPEHFRLKDWNKSARELLAHNG